jgi:hypothetical protein
MAKKTTNSATGTLTLESGTILKFGSYFLWVLSERMGTEFTETITRLDSLSKTGEDGGVDLKQVMEITLHIIAAAAIAGGSEEMDIRKSATIIDEMGGYVAAMGFVTPIMVSSLVSGKNGTEGE